MNRPLKVYIIAGEQSGDLLGARVMDALKRKTDVCFYGIGGETMEGAGLKSLFDIRDLSVMGFLEVVPKIPKILSRLNMLVQDIVRKKPDVILTIDAYSFAIRVHKKLKKMGCSIPHVHLVAPQVWAWKKGRAKTIGQVVDYLFCLLPGEPALFQPYGMASCFVGHPVLESGADKGNADRFCKKYGIEKGAKIIALLPGSRHNEVAYLMPVFMQAAKKLKEKIPSAHFVLPTVPPVRKEVQQQADDSGLPCTLISGATDRYDAFAACDFAIAASGTISLELALAKVPHLIAYKLNPLTAWAIKKIITVKYVNLLNLLMDTPVIPELLQEQCTADNIVKTALTLMGDKKQAQQAELALAQLRADQKKTPSDLIADKLIQMGTHHG